MLMETPIGAFDLDLSDFELGTKVVKPSRSRNNTYFLPAGSVIVRQWGDHADNVTLGSTTSSFWRQVPRRSMPFTTTALLRAGMSPA